MDVSPRQPRSRKRQRAADADDGAVFRDQGGQSGLPAVLPDGRFLRAVLRRRRGREPGARHRADQARQARGRGHPHVRRAGRARRRLSQPADRARPSRRGLRADRGPGGGEEARREVGRQARRRPARHARHDHRGAAARARPRPPSRRGAEGIRGGDARWQLYGLAALDLSTGAFALSEADEAGLAAEIARLEPSEIVAAQAVFDEPTFPQHRRRPARARDAARRARPATARRPSAGSASSTASRRSTASAPSPAPRSPPRRWRWPMSSAPSSRRGRPSRRRPGGRAARASRSTRRPAPISNSPGRSAARARARCSRRSTSP